MAAAAAPQPEQADHTDPEVLACAAFALEHLSRQNPLHPRYSITRFLSVQRANIGGGQYDMEVEVMSQPQTEEQADGDSTRTPPSEQQVLRCHFVVLSVPWKDQRVLLHSSCSPVSSTAQEF
ncbi:cystatin-POGU1-like [Conger conger]|uniref:cystatin-POGU1-like n=1 Tax=Conger conger TaxID=82655 RepID=UPI002A59BCFF|nr:cystatin-POGU1-like [Conger conger]